MGMSRVHASDLAELGRCTDGYSGSDISVVVRDALYEPVRTCQLATHFKKVQDPTARYEFLWEPCSPSASGAVEMTLMDMPGERLQPIELNMRHLQAAVRQSKPTVSPRDLVKQEQWTLEFGQDGSL